MTKQKSTVVVAGSSGTLGFSTVQELLKQGYHVTACYNSYSAEDKLRKLIASTPNQKSNLSLFQGDLLKQSGYSKLIEQIHSEALKVQGFISTIGSFAYNPCEESSEREFDHLFNMNMKCHWLAARNFLPIMKAERNGRIVFISSFPSIGQGHAGLGLYLASKAALNMFVKCLAQEVKSYNLSINAVLPGTMDTPQNRQAMGTEHVDQWLSPSAVSATILDLVKPSEHKVNGALITIPDDL